MSDSYNGYGSSTRSEVSPRYSIFLIHKITIMNNELPVAPALILIDIQKAFDQLESFGGEKKNTRAEENVRLVLEYLRGKKKRALFIHEFFRKKRRPLLERQTRQ